MHYLVSTIPASRKYTTLVYNTELNIILRITAVTTWAFEPTNINPWDDLEALVTDTGITVMVLILMQMQLAIGQVEIKK